MNLVTRSLSKFYELAAVDGSARGGGALIFHKRILIGRSDNCDLTILHSSVSAIHAVLEVSDQGGRIYDMNSRAGVRVNGAKVICQNIKIGDRVTFGSKEFIFKEYHKAKSLPPVLDALGPEGMASYEQRKTERVMPTPPPPIDDTYPPEAPAAPSYAGAEGPKRLPGEFGINPEHIITDDSGDGLPYISYPLAKDPKAEFSEYIFEDAGHVYPIFKWSIEKTAAEVVILHKDRIFSVDYLPPKKGVYHIKGFEQTGNGIEFPTLGRKESVPFLQVNGGQVTVEDSLGYRGVLISDQIQRPEDFKEKEIMTPTTLGPQDILKLEKGDLQIFVRNSESPPTIKAAPLFRRDNDSRKYFVMLSVLLLLFLGMFSTININKEIEKEKQPERVATILYNRKKVIYKKRRVSKPTPKKVVPKTIEKPKTTPRPTPKVAQAKPVKKPKPTPVKKEAPPKKVAKPKPVKKVAPPAPKRVVKKVTPKPKPVKKVTPKPKPVKRVAKKPKPVKKVARAKPTKRPTKRPAKTVGPPKKRVGSPRRTKTRRARTAQRKSRRPDNTSGHVDAYKPSNKFAGKLSRLMAKGGRVSGVQAERVGGGSVGISGGNLGGATGGVESAAVAKSVGSLQGAASGSLDQTRGTEGLVSKKGIAVAGIPSNTVVMGDYDASVVADILREHLPQFRYCYQKELDRANKVSGRIQLHFNIGASGRVAKAGVARSALPASVEGCVVNVLKGIKFPPPLGGGVVAIRQPMNFSSRSG